MVIRVAGSLAYLEGDGIITFREEVKTVGELKHKIEETTNIPLIKQVRRTYPCSRLATFQKNTKTMSPLRYSMSLENRIMMQEL